MKRTNELKGLYKMDMNLLQHLYKIRSFSRMEEPMTNFLQQQLTTMGIQFEEYNGNIFSLCYKDTPILVAHQDMVNAYPKLVYKEEPKIEPPKPVVPVAKWPWQNQATWNNYTAPPAKTPEEIAEEERKQKYLDEERLKRNTVNRFSMEKGCIAAFNHLGEQVSLGADDKNGIFAILELLKMGYKFNFIFTIGEECGCIGIKELLAEKTFADSVESKPFALIIDRRNGRDIIGFGNEYCVGLDYKIEQFSESLGIKYTCAQGLCSDADHISNHIECVNLSCGYYEAHSEKEYTNLKELKTTILLAARILDEFKYESLPVDRYKKKSYSSYSTFSSRDDDYYGWDNGGWEDSYSEKKPQENAISTDEMDGRTIIICPQCQTETTLQDIWMLYGECPMCSLQLLDDNEGTLMNGAEYIEDEELDEINDYQEEIEEKRSGLGRLFTKFQK